MSAGPRAPALPSSAARYADGKCWRQPPRRGPSPVVYDWLVLWHDSASDAREEAAMLDDGTSGAGAPPDRTRFDGTAAAARERSRQREQLTATRARSTRLFWSGPAESGRPGATPDLATQVPEQLVMARERIGHLETALATNRRIGIAIGIVMVRHQLTDEQALELLREQSQVRNKKLRDLAEEVVYTGTL